MSIRMLARRFFVAGVLALPSSTGFCQAAEMSFVGTWKGDVPGIGEVTLIVTSIGAMGRVEGKMEFALQGFVSTFGDKADSIKRINQGTVVDGTLTIEAALGGRYTLRQDGDALAGRYTRGTTMDVPVMFNKP